MMQYKEESEIRKYEAYLLNKVLLKKRNYLVEVEKPRGVEQIKDIRNK